jgi:hypothetical protein
MPSKKDAYLIRFPDGLRAKLTKEAKAQARTLAAHIVHLLETHPDRVKARK